jgi:hypothetical protein
MAQQRRVKVRGIRKEEISADQLAVVFWLLGKAAVEERRQREAEEKKKRAGRSLIGKEGRAHARR